MQIFLIILAIICFLLAVSLLVPVRLSVVYEKYAETSSDVTLKYGFITYKIYPKQSENKRLPEKEEKEDKPKNEPFSFEEKKRELEKYIRIFESIKSDVIKILKYMTKRAVVFEKIEVISEFGFEDAMQTGIFTGLYNGIVYTALGIIHQNSKLRDMKVNLQPVFEKKCFNNRFCCILHVKTVHIMIIAFNVLRIYRKIKKEGRK